MEKTRETKTTISLDANQEDWLKAMLQNPCCDDPSDEDPKFAAYRCELFHLLEWKSLSIHESIGVKELDGQAYEDQILIDMGR